MNGGMERPLRYMLDTNTASYIIKGNPPVVRERLRQVPMASVCISAVTQAELLLGLEKKPDATKLRELVNEFLLRVEILPWDSDAAESYARLRADCERNGTPLGSMDMLIAAHSVAAGTVLVASDRAFYNVKFDLHLADWAQPMPH
ncbi:type II toxin-antitoxin system VapC family toxin [Noviherbaspirillum agri]